MFKLRVPEEEAYLTDAIFQRAHSPTVSAVFDDVCGRSVIFYLHDYLPGRSS
jgi:hypothetical protein